MKLRRSGIGGLRQVALAILDSTPVKAIFGAGLPLVFVFAAWNPIFALREPGHYGSGFNPSGHAVLGLILFLVLARFAWELTQPRGRILPQAFAFALSTGTALAAAYAIFLLGVLLRRNAAIESARFSDLPALLLAGAIAATPLLSGAVFFRAACGAWKVSKTRASAVPERTVSIIVLGLFASAALLWLIEGQNDL